MSDHEFARLRSLARPTFRRLPSRPGSQQHTSSNTQEPYTITLAHLVYNSLYLSVPPFIDSILILCEVRIARLFSTLCPPQLIRIWYLASVSQLKRMCYSVAGSNLQGITFTKFYSSLKSDILGLVGIYWIVKDESSPNSRKNTGTRILRSTLWDEDSTNTPALSKRRKFYFSTRRKIRNKVGWEHGSFIESELNNSNTKRLHG